MSRHWSRRWHATSTGAFTAGIPDVENDRERYALGCKDATPCKTTTEILDRCERLAVDPEPLLYASRTATRVDSAALQDEYQLYHHVFFISAHAARPQTRGMTTGCHNQLRPVSPNLQPTLQGRLVTLRPLRQDDFPALFDVASDPLIWAVHPDPNRYKEDVFREFFREGIESGGALLALDARDGRVIGTSRFHGYDEAKSEIEIGWTFLARSHWGGIYNGEMKTLMLQHAFAFVNRVIFLVGPENWRSQRALEKIGAVRAGSRTNESGRLSLVYEILNHHRSP